MQVLRAAAATLTATFDAPPGATAVTVTRLDGSALYSAQPATLSGNAATFALAAGDTALLDTLTATFVSADQGTLTVVAEVVGAYLFTVAEARAFDKAQLADAGVYRDAAIVAARERITDDFAQICGVSFVPRYRYSTVPGEDWATFTLPDRPLLAVRSVSTRYAGSSVWADFTSDQLAALEADLAGGLLARAAPWAGPYGYATGRPAPLTVRVGYEYGYSQPPQPVRHAALLVALSQLVPTNINQRTMSFSAENGQTFRFATPGVGRFSPYGLPEADAILDRWRETTAGIA